MLTDDRSALLSTAETNAIRALSLDPDRALGHRVLATIYNMTNRSAQGIAECEQALALDRNLTDAQSIIGMAKYYLGRAAETERHIFEAFRLSPRDIFAHRWLHFLGVAKIQLGADAEAAPSSFDEALRPTAILLSPILRSPPRWVCRAHWMRHGRQRPRDSRSTRASPSAACAPPSQVTIRHSWLGANACIQACVCPAYPKGDVRSRQKWQAGPAGSVENGWSRDVAR